MKAHEEIINLKSGAMLLLFIAISLLTVAALNGGTAVSASSWDTVVTYLKTMLTSTWVLVLGLIALVVCVWQLAHGQGYRSASFVLAIMAFALIGPGVVTAMATATGEVGSIEAPPPIQGTR